MNIEKIDREKIVEIYNTYMINDFPKSELKSYEFIVELLDKKSYDCYGFYDSKELIGYVFFAYCNKYILVDYLAVLKKYRGMGMGSNILNIVANKFLKDYELILLEVEDIAYAMSDKDKQIREKRIDFYLKNNVNMSNVRSRVMTDNYNIMYFKQKKVMDDEKIMKSVEKVYLSVFGGKFCKENVLLNC